MPALDDETFSSHTRNAPTTACYNRSMQFEGSGLYTEGALKLLQYVESRRPTGRRFGPDADARWNSFRGDLMTVDRIELMIRDADAEWPGGFGARNVYGLQGVAEDEPFGSQWEGMDPVLAEELWRRLKSESPPTTPGATLRAIAATWDLTLVPHRLVPIAPTDHIVAAGPSAIVALVEAFAEGAALDWSEQVIVIASAPGPRQLAAAATAILNAVRPTRMFTAKDSSAPRKRGTRAEISTDAAPADREAAEALASS